VLRPYLVKKVNTMSLQNTVMQLRKGITNCIRSFLVLRLAQFARIPSFSTGRQTRTRMSLW
jgi:hypothetical protein